MALLVGPRAAVAQGWRLAFASEVGFAEHRVQDQSVGAGVERSTGTLVGAGLRLSVASGAAIAVVGRTGVLHPGTGATLPRDVAELGLDGAYRMHDWIDLVAGVRVRSYTTAVARQRWTAPYLGAAARVPFAVRGLRATLDVALHPFASVSGLTRPEFAVTSAAGMAYARGRFDVQLRYAVERYDFARETTSERLEQLSALTLQVQVHALGRTP